MSEEEKFSSFPITLQKDDGTRVEMGINELEDKLQETRLGVLSRFYGEPVEEDVVQEIWDQSMAVLDSCRDEIEDGTEEYGAKYRQEAIYVTKVTSDSFYTIDLLRRKQPRLSHDGKYETTSELRVYKWYIQHYDEGKSRVTSRDVFDMWLESGEKSKPRINIDPTDALAIQKRFMEVVEKQLGFEVSESEALLGSTNLSHGEIVADALTHATQPGQTVPRRFPSLRNYEDRVPAIGITRGLHQSDIRYVDIILKALREGQIDEGGAEQKQLIEGMRDRIAGK